MKIRDLINLLENYSDDTEVVLQHDRGDHTNNQLALEINDDYGLQTIAYCDYCRGDIIPKQKYMDDYSNPREALVLNLDEGYLD